MVDSVEGSLSRFSHTPLVKLPLRKRVKQSAYRSWHYALHPTERSDWMWQRLWMWRVAYIVLLLVFAGICGVCVWFAYSSAQDDSDETTKKVFFRASSNMITAIENVIGFDGQELVHTFATHAGLRRTSRNVTTEPFCPDFWGGVEANINRYRVSLLGVALAPIVARENIAAFEQAVVAQLPPLLQPLFHVRPLLGGDNVTQPIVAPVVCRFWQDTSPDSRIPLGRSYGFGSDIASASDNVLLEWTRSARSGDAVMTRPAASTVGIGHTVSVLQPVYNRGKAVLENGDHATFDNVTAMVFALFKLSESIDAALETLEDEYLALRIHDISDGDDMAVKLYERNMSDHASHLQTTERVEIMSRRWRINVFCTPKFVDKNSDSDEERILWFGIGASIALIILLLILFMVTDRTKRASLIYNDLARNYQRAQLDAMSHAQAREVFLSNISHELRTPINGIVGTTDLLLSSDDFDSSQHQDDLRNLSECCEALQSMINDLLDYGRVKNGRMPLEYGRFSVGDAIASCLRIVSSGAQKKNITFTSRVDDNVPKFVVCDLVRTRQILINLLSNAIKFTGPGGRIKVEVKIDNRRSNGIPYHTVGAYDVELNHLDTHSSRSSSSDDSDTDNSGHGRNKSGSHRDQPTFSWLRTCGAFRRKKKHKKADGVAVSLPTAFDSEVGPAPSSFGDNPLAEECDTTIIFCVTDNGIGVSADKLNIIFDDFQQADTSTTRKYGGSGLGLSICKRLANIMGGDSWVESELGVGSSFYFSLRCGNADNVPGTCFQFDDADTMGVDHEARVRNVIALGSSPEHAAHSASISAEVEPSPVNPRDATPAPSPPLQPPCLLVIDDNPLNTKLAQRLVMKLGCECVVATSGLEGQQKLNETAFDLVFLDINMPDKDGVSIAKETRGNASSPNQDVPILAFSANTTFELGFDMLKEAGFTGFLGKPVRRANIAAAIEKYTGYACG
eukprot:TRINITY_DN2520_c0_g1_i1.p1 TRINITY_DN2520_c0_g1~~TRINITY_DN2520_c0_g1_i1.p1  ORF type:complete len:962 (+),score=134.14 TRINITY_DN2520_c0_g1_i1:368-3253(+)